ncbi:MAG: hypothetical protein L3J58_06055 [Emcibacter sp.]|nr:hypothetical protein [Emcibacter sp.]
MLIFSSVSEDRQAYITVESCRILLEHIPADDVSYKGGVDVRGKSVKSADLYESPDLGLKDEIIFQLILDVAKENRGSANAQKQFQEYRGLLGYLNLGQIIVKDGNVTLDGKPLAGKSQAALYKFCAKNKKPSP